MNLSKISLINFRNYSKCNIKLNDKVSMLGYTLVPIKLYFKKNKAKILVGIAKGKKSYDKREAIAKKTQDRDIARQIKR